MTLTPRALSDLARRKRFDALFPKPDRNITACYSESGRQLATNYEPGFPEKILNLDVQDYFVVSGFRDEQDKFVYKAKLEGLVSSEMESNPEFQGREFSYQITPIRLVVRRQK